MTEKPKPKASANDRNIFMEMFVLKDKNNMNLTYQTPISLKIVLP